MKKSELSKLQEKQKEVLSSQQAQKSKFVPINQRKCYVCNKFCNIGPQCRFRNKNSSAAAFMDGSGGEMYFFLSDHWRVRTKAYWVHFRREKNYIFRELTSNFRELRETFPNNRVTFAK